jgi:hypothetical protein
MSYQIPKMTDEERQKMKQLIDEFGYKEFVFASAVRCTVQHLNLLHGQADWDNPDPDKCMHVLMEEMNKSPEDADVIRRCLRLWLEYGSVTLAEMLVPAEDK